MSLAYEKRGKRRCLIFMISLSSVYSCNVEHNDNTFALFDQSCTRLCSVLACWVWVHNESDVPLVLSEEHHNNKNLSA